MGAKKRPFYRIVVAHGASKRDGRSIEQLGWYDPMKDPAEISLDADKTRLWLSRGAQPSESVAQLLKRQGLLEPAKAAAGSE